MDLNLMDPTFSAPFPIRPDALGFPAQRKTVETQDLQGKAGSEKSRLHKAAQEFEGILLASLWKSMQKSSFKSKEQGFLGGGETLQDWGIHVMASSLAASGGMGIARMMIQQLEPAVDAREDDSREDEAGKGPDRHISPLPARS